MRYFIIYVIIGVLWVPFFALAQAPLVPCGNEGQGACDFNALIEMVERIIDLAILVAPFLAAAAFAWAGILYVTSPANESNVSRAHEIFRNTFVGLVVVLAAWLIVKAILVGLGANSSILQLLS